ncbi:molybdenum cofactor sulfurase 2-like isoform X2 [Malaya genurostris]|nr:molybdenum cofactor sulfurase 2-like isoform X2 [Malaya genurostris]
MDHAGTTLYAESQIRAVQNQLTGGLFCNPHTSQQTGALIDQVRQRVLQFFNTNSSEYTLIFTSGATASLRTIAECFTFRPPEDDSESGGSGAFVYLRDNHTSVLGMRAIVDTDRIHPLERTEFLRHLKRRVRNFNSKKPSLLVFPGQSNFNAAKYPLELIEEIQRNGLHGYDEEQFYVCLDAASYVSTNFLDLCRYRPDFVCLSFYKIFGYPTGLGALLIRNGSEQVLQKRYYGGGTIKILLSGQNLHMKHDSLEQRFEDGTQPFLSIIALLHGMNTIQQLIPPFNGTRSMDRVSKHVFNMAKYCYGKLGALEHSNGLKAIRFYMDTEFESRESQGGMVNFNVLREDGSYVGFAEFAQLARGKEIYVRTGCFCNAGTCQRQLGLTDADVLMFFRMGKICGDDTDLIEGMPTGTVRASFGYMSSPKDVDALTDMIEECFIQSSPKIAALKAIYIYPIRSCGAFSVTGNWPIRGKRLKFDREFTIVDCLGLPLSSFKHPQMASILPEIKNNCLVLRHDTEDDFVLDMDKCTTAEDCGDLVASWISRTLGVASLRLLKRSTDEGNSPQKLLVINWNALNFVSGCDKSAIVQLYRANAIFDAPNHFDMQVGRDLTIGTKRFRVTNLCTRRPMIHVNRNDSLKMIADVFAQKVPLGMYLVLMDDSNKDTGGAEDTLSCGTELKMATSSDTGCKAMIITDSITRYDFRVHRAA